MRDRVGPLWRIKQALEEIQGGNTQCEHPERKSLRGSGNTVPQESGCLLHSGDQIPWWQLSHKDTRYKLYWSGNDKGTAGVGVFVAEEWIEKVFEVQRVSDRIILVKLIIGPTEFRRVSMRRLSHWSGQQQHLLQWLQALDAQEMQWAQALEKRP